MILILLMYVPNTVMLVNRKARSLWPPILATEFCRLIRQNSTCVNLTRVCRRIKLCAASCTTRNNVGLVPTYYAAVRMELC